MRKKFALGLSAMALVASASLVGSHAFADDGPQSGVAVGDFVVPFDVLDVTGPNKGDTLCYR